MDDDDDLIPHAPVPPSPNDPRFLEISYMAPLPPPSMLEGYERVVPGSAKTILDRMERESDHRHHIETTQLHGGINAQRRGQWFAFIIALIGILGGFGLIWFGMSAVGLAVFVATLASLVAIFVYGKKRQENVLEKQLKQLTKMAVALRRPVPEPGPQEEEP